VGFHDRLHECHSRHWQTKLQKGYRVMNIHAGTGAEQKTKGTRDRVGRSVPLNMCGSRALKITSVSDGSAPCRRSAKGSEIVAEICGDGIERSTSMMLLRAECLRRNCARGLNIAILFNRWTSSETDSAAYADAVTVTNIADVQVGARRARWSAPEYCTDQ
jgi:hypothetical protein